MDSLARARDALRCLDPGCSREEWVRAGMAAKAAGLSLDDFTAWSSQAANFGGERDCATVWRSFSDGPVKAGTLFSMAFAAGWKDPTKTTRRNGHRAPQIARPIPNPIHRDKTPPRATMTALGLWERFEPATEAHGYIRAKRGRPDGLRVVPADEALSIAGQRVAGWLVVPAWSLSGELRTLQFIPPPGQGKKLNLPGASFEDGLFVVGDLAESGRISIVEGIGQAWACWSATGCAAVLCFGAGRTATVADILRRAYPDRRMILVPDRGKEAQAASIARAVRGEWVELPQDKPTNYDANDYALEHGAEELAELLCQAKTLPMRYRLLGASELMNLPPLRWLVRGVLPAQGLAALYGASGSGKSFLALDLCAAVAAGKEWFDCRVSRATVAYVALEGEAGFAQRVQAWQLHQGHDLPIGLHFVMQPFDLRSLEDVDEMAEAVVASGGAGGLLVIDTLNRAAPGMDENSSVDMGLLVAAAKALQAKLGGVVLLIHHSGKDQAKGLRGHSSLHAALDAAIEVTRVDDRRDWRIAKAKDGNDGEAYPFRLAVVDIGLDDDGEPVTSCVVEPDTGPAEFRRVLPPKSGNQRVAWDALGEMLRQAGDARPKDAPETLPLNRPAVTLDAAIDRIREQLAEVEPKRKTERAKQALTGLQGKGLIAVDRGFVWVR
ncbi:MAG: AAA family ATPase [Betaproteobacteria bacterium]|nr:AAA family ATPase [Betaproteobacteria bacterium]